MPRSKLGLNLPIEKILAKKGCNPVALLAELVMAKDSNGEWSLTGRDRLMALSRLMDYQLTKKKPVEVVPEQDRNIEIVRQTFTMPAPAPSTTEIDIKPDAA